MVSILILLLRVAWCEAAAAKRVEEVVDAGMMKTARPQGGR